jgi:hypothetical protein
MSSKTSATASDADRQAVLGVLKGVYEAWEANDAEAFVAGYLDDASGGPAWRLRADGSSCVIYQRPAATGS